MADPECISLTLLLQFCLVNWTGLMASFGRMFQYPQYHGGCPSRSLRRLWPNIVCDTVVLFLPFQGVGRLAGVRLTEIGIRGHVPPPDPPQLIGFQSSDSFNSTSITENRCERLSLKHTRKVWKWRKVWKGSYSLTGNHHIGNPEFGWVIHLKCCRFLVRWQVETRTEAPSYFFG